MIEPAQIAVVVAILGVAVLFGTDMFCAVVLRPALTHLDDGPLASATGFMHAYGDRRMPVFGIIGGVGAGVATVLAGEAGQWAPASAAGIAVAVLLGWLLVGWLLVYRRVSAPINRELIVAATGGCPPGQARQLQGEWDRVITLRTVLQGAALAALCMALIALTQ
ncbi:hypothetical protein BHQ15_00155 [Mycolicibacillus koreensis]|nr:hypothetical protein BHQ15_00155 [Mycolicibacillus koreensis]